MKASLLLLLAPAWGETVEEPTPALESASREEGLSAFAEVYGVLQHPRCLNCHPDGDKPLQTDESTPHTMEVTRLSVLAGLPCLTCHRETGITVPGVDNLPPADPHWRMPNIEQAFENRSLQDLCAQLSDPSRTGDRDLTALLEHVRSDHLVLNSWHSPRTPPPLSHDDFTDRFATWVAAGGPCPEDVLPEE